MSAVLTIVGKIADHIYKLTNKIVGDMINTPIHGYHDGGSAIECKGD